MEKKKGKVLLVDDEIEILTLLRDFLHELGYEADAFTSSKEALEAVNRQEFDLLLTDLVMPKMDGIELINACLEIQRNLVCIVITGKGTIQTAVDAMKSGAFDYLLKPVDWKTLEPVLSRAMEVRRLRDAEEKYRSIVEDFQTELISRFLPEGILTFVNDAYCRYFNKDREELIGNSFMDFIPEEDRGRIRKLLASINYENPVASLEYRVIGPDGEMHWQKWTVRAIFDRYRKLSSFQAVGRDITDRKRIEQELLRSEERYRLLVENANEIILVAQDGVIKFINSKGLEFMGYSKEELLSRPFTDFIHPDDRNMVFSNYLRRLKGEKLPDTYIFRVIDRSSNIKWIELSAVLFTWDGRPATLNLLTDITKRKEAEDEVKNLYQQIRSFAARLSEVEEAERHELARELHDQIGQNLTALGINLNILMSYMTDNMLEHVRSRIEDSMTLVEQTTTRIRDLMTHLRPHVMDDYGLLAVLRWYGEQFSKRTGIILEVKGEEPVPRLSQAVETTLFRIAQEALTNIAKHSGAGKTTIWMKESDGTVQLVISDDGTGFNLEEIHKLTDRPRWGILTMRERAQSIGGNIKVDAVPGKGTKVIIEVKR